LLLAFQAGTPRPPASAKATAGQARSESQFDVVILNGHIVDGTGSPWYAADVGIRNGRIAAIGRLANAPAKQKIDATGRIVAPGFIDMLGQSEMTVLVDPHLPSKIFQGITTEITGEGGSAAPLNDAIIKADKVDYDHLKITPDWRTYAQYFARVEKQGTSRSSACPSRTWRSRSRSRGCRSTTTRRGPRPPGFSARSTRTRARTGRFLVSSGSTCVRTSCCRWRRRSAR
jgi:hypothetical protein